MAVLKRKYAGLLEDEFMIRAHEFALGLAFREGRVSRGRALDDLMERRWSREDAEAYLHMAAEARL